MPGPAFAQPPTPWLPNARVQNRQTSQGPEASFPTLQCSQSSQLSHASTCPCCHLLPTNICLFRQLLENSQYDVKENPLLIPLSEIV